MPSETRHTSSDKIQPLHTAQPVMIQSKPPKTISNMLKKCMINLNSYTGGMI
jgi:hypothetical protein